MDDSHSDGSQSTGAGMLLAGRCRLGETIGRGGIGRMWRAVDETLHRTVAVMELTAGLYAAEDDREVRALHTAGRDGGGGAPPGWQPSADPVG